VHDECAIEAGVGARFFAKRGAGAECGGLRARESFFMLLVLWVAALLLAYLNNRTASDDYTMVKVGPNFTIRASVVIPIAYALIGWALGITRYFGTAPL
jgi:hypothetical protein